MPSAKRLLLAAGLVGICVAGCGTASKPLVGTPQADALARKQVDDPRPPHVACLRQAGVPVTEITVGRSFGLQIGRTPGGPRVVFLPTPGMAQGAQIDGQSESAEVIGSALLYPGLHNSDSLLTKVESCLAVGVKG